MAAPPGPARPRSVRALAERVRADFEAFVNAPDFSCLGARAALHHDAYRFGAYGAMGSGDATAALARDLAAFAGAHADDDFATFVAVFLDAPPATEAEFEARLWATLRALHAADAGAGWDPAVSDDPDDPHFSFSFGGRAFFIVGLHPESSRAARRFGWPALVFNPHAQFQRLRADGRYGRLRETIRAREIALQGTLNPNLGDFGEESEARQYSGRAVEPGWRCPFHHGGSPSGASPVTEDGASADVQAASPRSHAPGR
ncbi:MAG TPA: guanitoxin biosynthesis heme-dependent pre-guanitoxin N-hydroxylase GntA [Longimicrobiaceae bacterium]|nr:guanitoxin biosynthesis heme-dependent pre-guanitoxin N-hydroxylase GntA [Longimicrobiaceae bacterium]